MTIQLPTNPRWIFWEVDGCSGNQCVDLRYLTMTIERLEHAGYTITGVTRSY